MTDKSPLYTMVPPPYPGSSKHWLSRAALVLSSGGVLVALAALLLVVQQAAQLEATQSMLEAAETSIRLLEARLDQLTTLAINGELFEDIEEDEDVDDLHLLSRHRREATSEDVQIYNEAYRQNLTAAHSLLLHYPALQSDVAAGKKSAALIQGQGLSGNSLDEDGANDDEDAENISNGGLIHYPELQGRGRVPVAAFTDATTTGAVTGAAGVGDIAGAASGNGGIVGNSIADAGGEEYQSEEDEGYLVPVITEQDSRNNILPHHRFSSVWPKHTKFPSAKGPEHYSSPYRSGEIKNDVIYNNFQRQRTPTVERRSRVKTTSKHSYLSPRLSNTVLPSVTKVTQPKTKAKTTTSRPEELNLPLPQAFKSPVKGLKTLGKKSAKGGKKTGKRVTKNQTRRRRTGAMTVAHYVAQPANKVNGINNEGWTQAVWMDKLGLDKKYHLKRGAVIVKEAGLYYIYAQMLYQTGRFGTGYQVMVDSVPIMECSITQASPSDSCHTSGVTYLPSNAEVKVHNKESFMSPVDQIQNSFFGLIKLMDAPSTTEELMGR